jgi:hypothetical protein
VPVKLVIEPAVPLRRSVSHGSESVVSHWTQGHSHSSADAKFVRDFVRQNVAR